MPDKTFQLLTLGRLALVGPRSGAGEDPNTHRQKLALLVVLALADRPLSRDLLATMFWGDQPEARARHSLSNALSTLRRILGRAAIRPHRDEVSVDRSFLPMVDAHRFEEAVEREEWEVALALYAGPFLDGIHLGGAPGFEQWAASERARLETLFLRACAGHGAALHAAGRWEDLAPLASRWLESAPLSVEAGCLLLDALTASRSRDGDQRALEAFDALSSRLTGEYGRRPDREVQARARVIMERLRRGDATGEFQVPASTLHSDPPPRHTPAPAMVRAEGATHADEPRAGVPAERSRRWVPLAVAVAVGLLMVVGWRLATVRGTISKPAPSPSPAGGRPTVAIGAVRSAADSAGVWLAAGIQQMLSDRLARSAGVDVVAPERMRELLPPAASLSQLLAAARRAGARLAVSGAVTRSEDALVLDVNVHDSETGALVGLSTVSAANLIALADLAAVRVLVAAGTSPDGPSLGAVETASPEAYEYFIRYTLAQDEDRQADAVAALDAAIALDSGFVSALRERALRALRQGELERAASLLEAFRRNESRATEYDRLLLASQVAFYAGNHAQSEALARQLVDRYPRDPRAHNWLEEVYSAHGKLAEAEVVLLRLLALDSLSTRSGAGVCVPCKAYGRLVALRHARGDLPAAEAAARRLTQLTPDMARGWILLAVVLSAQGRHPEAIAAAEAARRLDPSGDSWVRVFGMVLLQARAWASADSFVRALRSEADPDRLAVALDLGATLARERGRHREAVALLDSLAREGGNLHLVAGNSLARLGMYREAERRFAAPAPAQGAGSAPGALSGLRDDGMRAFSWARALEADALAGSGNLPRLQQIVDSLTLLSGRSYYGRDWRLHQHVRGLLLAKEGRHADAAEAFRAAHFNAMGWSRSLAEQARSLLALRRPEEALGVLRKAYVVPLDGMGRYQTRTDLDLLMGLAFRQGGRADSAAAYERYVREAWAEADPEVRRELRSP